MAYRAYGIDLGHSSTKVAVVEDRHRSVSARNLSGEEATPSAVFFDTDGTVVIGSGAASALLAEPGGGTDAIKSALGTDFYRRLGGHRVSPEQVAEVFLSAVVAEANTWSDKQLRRVVLTAPVHLGASARRALCDAADRAELHVVAVLDEPVAVAFSVQGSTNTDQTVLVCDVGSTATTTVMKIGDGTVDIVATDSSAATGGGAFTAALIDLVIAKIVAQTSIGSDPRDDAEFMVELRYEIEFKKCALSKRSGVVFRCRIGTHDERITVTRDEFEAATEHLVSEVIGVVDRTLAEAVLRAPGLTIDRFLLAGGAARMPRIAERLQARGFAPLPTDDESAAAKGAAIYGEFLLRPGSRAYRINQWHSPADIEEPNAEQPVERIHRLEQEVGELRRANSLLRSTIAHLIEGIDGPGDYPTSIP